ncbi:MAG TPA: UDP-N-acetylmuramoyl-tripeptide--D-alanyl-D-alanine ligase, partial [Pirellulales bacterium]|nr:UDP-N-acetylmuramoyl-tripeptide--D-alanyl-D-alanine ligase [Pirellulales bacterium]
MKKDPMTQAMTPKQLSEIVAGRWLQPLPTAALDEPLTGQIVIDSRQVEPGDIFWAMPGATRHGAEFVGDALRRGASGVITDRTPPVNFSQAWALCVPNSAEALGKAAVWQREQFSGSVIGITGSVGKTTTRQLVDHVLASRYWGTASPRNYNNHLGVPLSMLAWRADQDYGVLEMGASAPGEIARLAGLARPHIAVVTRIAEAHLSGFGSRLAVATAKAELLDALPAEGWAVLNGDDPMIRRVAGRRKQRVTWVGRGADNDVTATHVRSGGGQLEFRVDGQFYTVPVWGRHHLTGALVAVAIGRSWGITPAEIADALAGFRSPAMRCEVSALGDASLINDAYNSNPTAMRAALELLRDFDNPGRRIVICGDMRELGDESARLHRNLGSEVVHVCGADMLIACGDYAADVVAG